jgi:hypothetical protein
MTIIPAAGAAMTRGNASDAMEGRGAIALPAGSVRNFDSELGNGERTRTPPRYHTPNRHFCSEWTHFRSDWT